MRTVFEIVGFAVLAAGLHLLVFPPNQDAGFEGAGADGEDLMSLAAATASMQAMVQQWDRPPPPPMTQAAAMTAPDMTAAAINTPAQQEPLDRAEPMELSQPEEPPKPSVSVEMEAPFSPPVPQVTGVVILPIMPPKSKAEKLQKPSDSAARRPPPAVAPQPPGMQSLALPAPPKKMPPPEPPTEPAVETDQAPPPVKTAKTKPKVEKSPPPQQPSQASAQSAGSKAKGSGAGVVKGNAKDAETATVSKAKQKSLLVQWGTQIRSKVARNVPRGAGKGTARVRITVSADGNLLAVSLIKSSGKPLIDKLALTAVRKAGRFPPAPKRLGNAKRSFALPITSR